MAGSCGSSDTPGGARRARLATAAAFAALLAACGTVPEGDVSEEVFQSQEERERERIGSVADIFGVESVAGVNVGSGRQQALSGTDVNRHLWRASLDTLSFLPIASTDPFTGLIATDWGPVRGAPDERFRVTAYVTDTTLDANALRVSVFREVRDGGAWAPAPVEPEVSRQIEDAILVRARQIRLAEATAEG